MYFSLIKYFRRQIRSIPTNRVHIGLSMSLLIANICLLIGAERTSNKGSNQINGKPQFDKTDINDIEFDDAWF